MFQIKIVNIVLVFFLLLPAGLPAQAQTAPRPEVAKESAKTAPIPSTASGNLLKKPDPVSTIASPSKSESVPAAPAPMASPPPGNDKIVAIINGNKVKLSDIERELRRYGRTLEGEEFTIEKRDRVLYSLITNILIEEYLRDNNNLNDLELQDNLRFAKEQALGDYLVLMIARKIKPLTDAEIDQFIAEHPDFFQQRRAYEYVDISIEKYPGLDINQISAYVEKINNKQKDPKKKQTEINQNQAGKDEFEDIINYAMGKKVMFTDFRGSKNSEQIDEPILQSLKTMTNGNTILINLPEDNNIHVLKLINSVPNATNPKRARVGIINGMYLSRATEETKQILAEMRENVKIKIIDDLSSMAVRKKQALAVNELKENIEQKIDKEFEKTQQIIKQMQQVASAKVSAEILKRKNRTNTSDKRNETVVNTKLNKTNYWIRQSINAWIFSLPVFFVFAFYHYLVQTEKQRLELFNKQSNVIKETVESSIQNFFLSPFAGWVIGITFFWFLAQTSWTKLKEINYLIFTSNMMILCAITIMTSLALVWVLGKLYNYFPLVLRNNSRFMFLFAIGAIQVAMIFAG